MPWEPIPLKFGKYAQGPFTYILEPSGITDQGWRLIHDPQYSYVGVDYAPEVVNSLELFKTNHEFYSRSPESPWMDGSIGCQAAARCGHERAQRLHLEKMERQHAGRRRGLVEIGVVRDPGGRI